MSERDAIKDVLRRDALCRGPWALRILDEIERLEREIVMLRSIVRKSQGTIVAPTVDEQQYLERARERTS